LEFFSPVRMPDPPAHSAFLVIRHRLKFWWLRTAMN
jgi:hypothetical protein